MLVMLNERLKYCVECYKLHALAGDFFMSKNKIYKIHYLTHKMH